MVVVTKKAHVSREKESPVYTFVVVGRDRIAEVVRRGNLVLP